MVTCDHHNLLGHCEATSDGAPMMILELMQHGDLKWFLKTNRYCNQINTYHFAYIRSYI